ncbi:MAG: hypothetical protein JXR39_12460 [Marinilabiliaceae bacterium]|nr:hypothetical protein [Marinilabiliaceae bacterium]
MEELILDPSLKAGVDGRADCCLALPFFLTFRFGDIRQIDTVIPNPGLQAGASVTA